MAIRQQVLVLLLWGIVIVQLLPQVACQLKRGFFKFTFPSSTQRLTIQGGSSGQTADQICSPDQNIRFTGVVWPGFVPVLGYGGDPTAPGANAVKASNAFIPDVDQARTAENATVCSCWCADRSVCIGYTWLGGDRKKCWLHSAVDFLSVPVSTFLDPNDNTTSLLSPVPEDTVIARVVLQEGDVRLGGCPAHDRFRTYTNTLPGSADYSSLTQPSASTPLNISQCNDECLQQPNCTGYAIIGVGDLSTASGICRLVTKSNGTTDNNATLGVNTIAAPVQVCSSALVATDTPSPASPSTISQQATPANWTVGIRYEGGVLPGWQRVLGTGWQLADGTTWSNPLVSLSRRRLQGTNTVDTWSNRYIPDKQQGLQPSSPEECNQRCSSISSCIAYTWLGGSIKECWLHSWVQFWATSAQVYIDATGNPQPVPPDTIVARVIKANWTDCKQQMSSFAKLAPAGASSKGIKRPNPVITSDISTCNAECGRDPACIAFSFHGPPPADNSSVSCVMYSSISGDLVFNSSMDYISYTVPLQACPQDLVAASAPSEPGSANITESSTVESPTLSPSTPTGPTSPMAPASPTPPGTPIGPSTPAGILAPAGNSTNAGPSTPSGPSATAGKQASTSAASSSSGSNKRTVTIAVAVAVPVGILFIAAGSLVWWRSHGRAHKGMPIGAGFSNDGEKGQIIEHTYKVVVTTPDDADMSALSPTGLLPGDPFTPAARQFGWVDYKANEHTTWVESGINDTQLDKLSQDGTCPAVELKAADMGQIELLRNGLIGKGGAALVFACRWPSRFGPDALLAIKVLRNAYDASTVILQSFSYEAQLLSSLRSPHVVKLYGYCLELPVVALIMELLPTSLESLLHPTPQQAPFYLAFVNPPLDAAAGQAIMSDPSKMSVTCTDTTASSSKDVTSSSGTGNTQHRSGIIETSTTTSSRGVTSMSGTGSTQHKSPASTGHGNTLALLSVPHSYDAATAYHTATNHSMHSVQPHQGAPAGEGAVHNEGTDKASDGNKKLSMLSALQIAADVAAGLAYLHNRTVGAAAISENDTTRSTWGTADTLFHQSSKIVHRDLKPANLLINSRGQAKIVDFGLAREFATTTMHTMHAGAGTLLYMAPELLASRMYTGAMPVKPTYLVDIYSLGILMWEMLSQQKPWQDMNMAQLIGAVCGKQRPPMPNSNQIVHPNEPMDLASTPAGFGVLPDFDNLIRQCWQHRDLRRPQAAEVLSTLQRLLQQAQQHGKQLTVHLPVEEQGAIAEQAYESGRN